MITIRPIRHALVPVHSAAAARLSAPNYDEFQSDEEIREAIRRSPDSVLRITMAHCDAPDRGSIGTADSDAALAAAADRMDALIASPLTREVERLVFVYELDEASRPGVRQIGLGGMARTEEIRTDASPEGPIIRNEGVRIGKARGRARLIQTTRAIIGMVNHAVPDEDGSLASALEAVADAREADLVVRPGDGVTHRLWWVLDSGEIERLSGLLARQPEAYVADGNHRSAAAAILGEEGFLAVFFPAARMSISPYNRLVRGGDLDECLASARLESSFHVTAPHPADAPFQPLHTHEIGLYQRRSGWRGLTPCAGSYPADDAAASIDHAIVQAQLFEGLLGIADPGSERLVFVGANRDAAWLMSEVDAGRAGCAVTLPAVTMDQFIAVCRQGRMMPPKSTWFEPKVRSGLVMALLD